MLTINLLWRTCTIEDDIKGKVAVERLLHGIQVAGRHGFVGKL